MKLSRDGSNHATVTLENPTDSIFVRFKNHFIHAEVRDGTLVVKQSQREAPAGSVSLPILGTIN